MLPGTTPAFLSSARIWASTRCRWVVARARPE
jgi:hypothetical protein